MKTLSKILTILLSAAALLAACGKEDEAPVKLEDLYLISPASGSLTMIQGETYRIDYGTVPENASSAQIYWSSTEPSVASVDGGVVKAHAPGQTVINMMTGELSVSIDVKVKGIPATSFSVPAEINAYTTAREIPLTIEPANANAASLDWAVEDENIATVTIKDGKAWLQAVDRVETGVTKVTVSGEGLESQTIEVTALAQGTYAFYSYIDGSKTYEEATGTLDFNLLTYDDENPDVRQLIYMASRKVSDVSVKVDNPKICTVTAEVSEFLIMTLGTLSIAEGTEYGSTKVTVTTVMEGLTFKNVFTVARNKIAIPEDLCIYCSTRGCALAGETEVKRGETLRMHIVSGGDTPTYHSVKWTTSDASLATVSLPDGKEYSSDNAIVTVNSGKTGKVTITGTDATGKITRSVVLNVVKEKFSDSVVLKDTGSGVTYQDGGTYACQYGYKTTVILSENFKYSVWSSSDPSVMKIEMSPTVESQATLTFNELGKDVTLSITDEAGSRTLTYHFHAELSLKSLKLVPESDDVGYYAHLGLSSPDWIYMPFLPGNNTVKLMLKDTNGHIATGLNSGKWTFVIENGFSTDDVGLYSNYIIYSTSSTRDKTLVITDQFGNQKSVIIRPCLDFRDHDAWRIMEETADNGTQYLKYSYDFVTHDNFNTSKNKVGSNWDYYRIRAVANKGGSYAVDITDCVGRVVAYACDWQGKDADGNPVKCGLFKLSSIAEMIKHIKDEDEKVSASHPHHDTHDYFCQFSVMGSRYKADDHGFYGVPLFLLRVKE
ncbi:MAG: Ig-like domain-containing protein [Candidatus Cryptobacteroides sp.]